MNALDTVNCPKCIRPELAYRIRRVQVEVKCGVCGWTCSTHLHEAIHHILKQLMVIRRRGAPWNRLRWVQRMLVVARACRRDDARISTARRGRPGAA